jgi:AcrR family transcriptional regulator
VHFGAGSGSMQRKPPESEGADERPFTSAVAGARLRRAQRAEAARIRAEVERSVIHLVGERGYHETTATAVVERLGMSRARFYSLFAGKAECYASAYGAAGEMLVAELLAPCEESVDWLAALRAALDRLAIFLVADPVWARGVLGEVQAAGGAAMEKRAEMVERLSEALERVPRERLAVGEAPPAVTALFLISAIEGAAVRSLLAGRPESFAESVPDFLHMAASFYLDRETKPAGPAERLRPARRPE